MENDIFDGLSRRLARGLSRRSLAGVAGVGVASSLAMSHEVTARNKKEEANDDMPTGAQTMSHLLRVRDLCQWRVPASRTWGRLRAGQMHDLCLRHLPGRRRWQHLRRQWLQDLSQWRV